MTARISREEEECNEQADLGSSGLSIVIGAALTTIGVEDMRSFDMLISSLNCADSSGLPSSDDTLAIIPSLVPL